MQKKKKLSIECVNRVKLEQVGKFQDSIFSDVYRNAHMLITRILNLDDAKGEDAEAEQFCTGNERSNVIAFTGERGMGKSSAMLSFAYYLKKYPNNLQEKEEMFRFEKDGKAMTNLNFYTLPKIDVAILTNESLFDVVLAKMWTDFSDKLDKLGEVGIGFNRTTESFNSIKRAYTLYYEDEKQNKNLTSVRQLQDLSRSLALRGEFARLTASFLECMVADNRVAEKNRYLVIPIDDLDLASEKTIAVLEQLRIFLSVPQVIILTTVDIEKLLLCGNKKFSDELICSVNAEDNDKSLVRQYSNQYIAKVLPRNCRIYMPRYGENEAGKYVLDYDKYVSKFMQPQRTLATVGDVDYLSFTNMIVAKYLNLIIGQKDGFNFPGESLRNIVNKLNELWTICHYDSVYIKEFVYEWFEKEIMILQNQLDGRTDISLLKLLQDASFDDYNEYILADCKKDETSMGLGYGQVLRAILDARDTVPEKREMLRVLTLLYSLRLAKCIDEEDERTLNELFVKKDIFASFMSRRGRIALTRNRRIDNILRLDMAYENDQETLIDIFKKNAQQIVDVFKVLMFYEVEAVIKNAELEISRVSGGEKDISGVKTPNDMGDALLFEEKLVLRIQAKPMVSRFSFDNFFENAIRYDDLFGKYILWIYEKLNDYIHGKRQKRDGQDLYKKVLAASENGVAEMKKWKTKYDIKGIYDIFPVQDVGIMLEVMDRMKYSVSAWTNIDMLMQKFAKAYLEEFRKAEDKCLYAGLGRWRYSDKFWELLNWINLDSISSEIKGRLVARGQTIEDTTAVK